MTPGSRWPHVASPTNIDIVFVNWSNQCPPTTCCRHIAVNLDNARFKGSGGVFIRLFLPKCAILRCKHFASKNSKGGNIIFNFDFCRFEQGCVVGIGFARSRRFLGGVGFRTTLEVGVVFFVRLRLRKSNSIIFSITLLSWELLLKWCKFFLNFRWSRESLLCATISINC